jgi:TrmH family RNA methyltransferase
MTLPLPPALTSASAPLARQARALGRGARERREQGLFLVEGPRGLEEALDAAAPVEWVLLASGRIAREPHATLAARCLDAGVPVQPVQDALLERLVSAESGPGIAAACRLPQDEADSGRALNSRTGPAVVCWEIQNPGNVGAILRCAAAFGARGVLTAGGADPWGPKAVRASAGAIHRLSVARLADPAQAAGALLTRPLRRVAAVARGGLPPDAIDWSGDVALLLGSEVAGLPADIAEDAERVTIPTSGRVESLSVPVAAAILLAHAFAVRR